MKSSSLRRRPARTADGSAGGKARKIAKAGKLAAGGSGGRGTHRRSGEIIDAAARVFAELGYHGATTQKIADVLRIRQASLYYYFPSKEAALEQVCLRGVAGFFETAKAIAEGPGRPAERLAGLMRAHISPILDRGDFVKVFLTQRRFLPNASRRRVGKWSRGLEQIFEMVIREGMRVGDFRDDADPRLTTLAILGMSNAVPSWYAKENVSVERIGHEFIALILHGLESPARPSRRRPK
ncbi:MAG TPA: TetR/AcrR family transcriptional regulator [Pseudolabrys sp.]|nr:TetR/AcrR family transcriptional regulator [Pseudolabrys sp.]